MIKIMNDFLCEIQTGNVEEDKEETKNRNHKMTQQFCLRENEREREGGGGENAYDDAKLNACQVSRQNRFILRGKPHQNPD